MDVSADLTELGRTPVAVVCAGAKSILDIPRTLEVLETQVRARAPSPRGHACTGLLRRAGRRPRAAPACGDPGRLGRACVPARTRLPPTGPQQSFSVACRLAPAACASQQPRPCPMWGRSTQSGERHKGGHRSEAGSAPRPWYCLGSVYVTEDPIGLPQDRHASCQQCGRGMSEMKFRFSQGLW